MHFVGIHVVNPYSSIDTATAWKKFRFILSDRSDLYMTDNLLIAFYAFTRHILKSLSVDEILLMRYVNLTTNFRGLPLRVEMVPSCLINALCFVFMWRPMPLAVYSGLYCRDSA